uniref:hypothetical protein n=1 Tax=Pseudomonas sp. TH32 TaxID=2796397 RepID=UPI001A92BF55|nr:hypothetical protein [Pseudomonas sp. TH32]
MTPRTWLITGANSGFGREMTEQLLARGSALRARFGMWRAWPTCKHAMANNCGWPNWT